jgi:DNA-binding transcriptional LysR family regulator
MIRNLDVTALRSFLAIHDAGGVTRAAHFLNLTQSAVSMQIKRLEEMLGLALLDRSGRGVTLTPEGEVLMTYARKMVAQNDEAVGRLMSDVGSAEIVLGVPHDIVYPVIPKVLQDFARSAPRTRVTLLSSVTRNLKASFQRAEAHLILTTERTLSEGGETLVELPLVWVGAPGGVAWRGRPLKLAFEQACIFRTGVQEALDRRGVRWEMAVESDSTRTIEATVSADLAVHVALFGSEPPYVERIEHGGALPELGSMKVNLYVAEVAEPGVAELADLVRRRFVAHFGALSMGPRSQSLARLRA